MKESSLGNRS